MLSLMDWSWLCTALIDTSEACRATCPAIWSESGPVAEQLPLRTIVPPEAALPVNWPVMGWPKQVPEHAPPPAGHVKDSPAAGVHVTIPDTTEHPAGSNA